MPVDPLSLSPVAVAECPMIPLFFLRFPSCILVSTVTSALSSHLTVLSSIRTEPFPPHTSPPVGEAYLTALLSSAVLSADPDSYRLIGSVSSSLPLASPDLTRGQLDKAEHSVASPLLLLLLLLFQGPRKSS
jgi:hypothetical protein